jgi:hypothetical protein
VRLHQRLKRLEVSVGPDPGCPICRDRRGRTVLVTSRRLPDGTTTQVAARPAPCERCRGVPERVIHIAYVVVETQEDVARLAAGTA